MNFKERVFCIIILKAVLSLIFICQFCYSYELAERKYIDDGKVFDTDAKLSSSHVIFMTMITSAVTLSIQRLLEIFLFTQLREWARDKKNFKVSSDRTHSKYAKSGKSSRISSSSSSDGSTEASHRGEEDLFSTQDKPTVS